MSDFEEKRNICLIGGTGRCGTSILSSIFARHPDVAEVPEWRFMIDPDGIIDYLNSASHWSPYHMDIRIKRLEKMLDSLRKNGIFTKLATHVTSQFLDRLTTHKLSKKYMGLEADKYAPNFNRFAKQLIMSLYGKEYEGSWIGMPFYAKKRLYYSNPIKYEHLVVIFREFYIAIIDDVLRHQSAKVYLEKNTWNILWLDRILDILPEARMVHIYRDPRDVVASFTQQSWMPSNPVFAAEIYRDLFASWESVKNRVPKNSYLEVSLEELSSQPKTVLMSICDFWEIPWHKSLLEQDLSRSHSGRWKKQFDLQAAKNIGDILKDPLKKLGYE